MSSAEGVKGAGLVDSCQSVFSILCSWLLLGRGIGLSNKSVLSFISFQDGGGMSQVSFGFPGIVTSGVTLPFDEVYVSSSLSFVRDYRL